MPTNNTPSIKTIDVAPVTFTPGKFQFQGADASILERSLAQREARRNQAVQSKTALDVSLGKVEEELHSNEAEWFQNYKDKLNKDFIDSVNIGDYGSAFRNATLKAGEVAKDPALIGRRDSNKAWNEYEKLLQTKVDNNSISPETKEMLEHTNKYEYKDKYDENGNIIKGDIWKPKREVFNDIVIANQAMIAFKLINPDKISSGFESTNTSNVGEDGSQLAITTGTGRGGTSSKEQVTSEEIHRIMEQLIKDTPGGIGAVEQKYDTYKFQIEKLQKELDILDPNSEEYKDKKQMLNQRLSLVLDSRDLDGKIDYKLFYEKLIQQELYSKGLAYKVETHTSKTDNSSIYNTKSGSSSDSWLDNLGKISVDGIGGNGKGDNVELTEQEQQGSYGNGVPR